MTDEQVNKIVKELKAIKFGIWTAVLAGLIFWTMHQVTQAIIGPPAPPVVSFQPPR